MKKSVLIVDDSKLVLDINSFAVNMAGFRTYTAINGIEALEVLSNNSIDLVLTDVNMPGMDGFTFIKKVREQKKFSETPIIIVTTEKEASDKKKGFDAGANVYLIKPLNTDETIMHINLLIG
jgi:two-component system chemotaxis response regulator CheY